MNDRIKILRRNLGLTQIEFASKIGTGQSNVAGYESGKRCPSAGIISSICKTFNVNEQWLRTGEGEMFAPKGDDVDEFLTKNHLSPKLRSVVETFFDLPEQAQAVFCEFLEVLKARREKEDADLLERAKAEVRAEVEAEALEKARQELRAEMEKEKEDKEAEALHVLLQAQIDRQKGDKGSTLVFGGTKSKEV